MMGQVVGQQDRLFYEFNLDERIPVNHLLRRIDAVLDLSWLRAELSPFYSHPGCPSIDPELMIRMLLVGYCYSIRSERRLCQEVELNLAYRWFCRGRQRYRGGRQPFPTGRRRTDRLVGGTAGASRHQGICRGA